ncbi:MAG TPA: UDP-N-acetylmuramoyl-L-alanyl-D-glutamate--2,6-diaminopimelate ligase [Tepidisphaeraceae bacterium]|jgi:UDP-N-acetylmuramoyl-L-alanyl-D-glutamate--2,6-diaminopimelate ligase|nr:UDP-N-acetylmuramoyl-L-alanyl-D-glutamate--2,6-diaminopimelate ligase [Tepidisphaeraceae bacterium]
MHLHTLLSQLRPRPSVAGVPNLIITGIADDSRLVASGNLFVARTGVKADGAAFVRDAQTKGAVACVVAAKIDNCPLPQIVVKDPAAAVSHLAHAFYEHPTDAVRVVGVTGTNGKTTTTYIIRHLLSSVRTRCGMVGTVEIDDGRARREATMTTPGAVELAGLFASMRDKGCRAAAIETSSHALVQGRGAAIRYAGAGFTNLTGDHLDYHGTMENYAAAKATLFAALEPDAVAVINGDDKWSDRMIQDCPARIFRFGFGKNADYRAKDVEITATGSNFTLCTPDGKANVSMGLIGKHNIENVLLAAALCGEVYGLSVQQLANGLKTAAGAPGRLQVVRTGQPFAVLVDYAHTDDALDNVLSALRPLTRGKLRVLFGCGGDRDTTKRPRMARTAERLADAVYITSDNPRTEQPQGILDQICCGLTDRAKAIVEIDRRAAIERILADAQAGDVVLLAGKGHENYQIVGTEKHHFDDVEEALRALKGKVAA